MGYPFCLAVVWVGFRNTLWDSSRWPSLLLRSFLLQLAKGQMLGGVDGFLKLLFDTNTLKLLGVHAFGEGATEIIHIGQVSGGGGDNYLCTA